MACEDVYRAVGSIVRELRLPRGARILEVGCGLGYLTFALARAGYAAQGWDASAAAIEAATKRFGPHYAVRDVDRDTASAERFDAIVFTSFIEHLADPIRVRRGRSGTAVSRRSAAGGSPKAAVTAIAAHSGLETAFFDFSAYNAARRRERIGPFPEPEARSLFPLKRSVLPALRNARRRIGDAVRGTPARLGPPRGRRLTLAAVLTRGSRSRQRSTPDDE